MKKIVSCIIIFFCSLLVLGTRLYAADPISITGTALVVNTSEVIDFDNFGSNVQVDPDTGEFSGFVWSVDMGWIDFGNGAGNPVMVDLDTGVVYGEALIVNTGGSVDFSFEESNVYVDLETGIFYGYVWSEDMGWINFEEIQSENPLARLVDELGDTGGTILLSVGGIAVLTSIGTFLYINKRSKQENEKTK